MKLIFLPNDVEIPLVFKTSLNSDKIWRNKLEPFKEGVVFSSFRAPNIDLLAVTRHASHHSLIKWCILREHVSWLGNLRGINLD